MNKQGRVSIDMLKQNMPDKINTVIVFGSQARNTQRPDSDLDIMCILNKTLAESQWFKLNWHICDILKCEGGVKSTTVFLDTYSHIQDKCNIYGTEYYYALRNNILVYGSLDGLTISPIVNYELSSTYWLNKAKQFLFKIQTKVMQECTARYMLTLAFHSVAASLKTVLLLKDNQFSHTKDLDKYAKKVNAPYANTIAKLSKYFWQHTDVNHIQFTSLAKETFNWACAEKQKYGTSNTI